MYYSSPPFRSPLNDEKHNVDDVYPVVVMFSIMMMISPSCTQRSSLKWYFLKNYAVFHHHAYEVFDYDDEHDDNFHDGDDDGSCRL